MVHTKEPDALSAVVWAMAQFIGKQAAVAVTAMTDNGGGTASGAFVTDNAVAPAVVGSTDRAPKAGLETAFGTVVNAISTCIAQANMQSLRKFRRSRP